MSAADPPPRIGDDLEAVVVQSGELLIATAVGSSSLPGSNPPPGQGWLTLVDPRGGRGIPLGSAGGFARLSAGLGPTMVAGKIVYNALPPEDPSGYSADESESSWVMFRDETEVRLPNRPARELVVSPAGDRLAWLATGTVTITDVDGAIRRTVEGHALAWGPNGEYAVSADSVVRTFDADDNEQLEIDAPAVTLVAWAPLVANRVLIESACDEEMARHRQQVFDGPTVVREVDCGFRKYGGWAPDGEALALEETTPADSERQPPRFMLLSVDGAEGPWLAGSICAFQPDQEHLSPKTGHAPR